MRGEYCDYYHTGLTGGELPPRARRIQIFSEPRPTGRGTTSACAENTQTRLTPIPSARNYLRVRGEYHGYFTAGNWFPELPPRARRIPLVIGETASGLGTTSACAENTPAIAPGGLRMRNYLRVRGEYHVVDTVNEGSMELPPRARRILMKSTTDACKNGTTSACAENTVFRVRNASTTGNYLRVRGEYITTASESIRTPELPPRARRIRQHRSSHP